MKKNILLTIAFAIAMPGFAIVDLNVPDKDGMNIKGIVKCGDEPVANVQVSDGVAFTKTDANGHYWLASKKECGYVFICNPDGYKTVQEGRYPQFYKFLHAGTSEVDRADFELEKETKKDYAVVFVADPQLCRRFYDWQQFEKYAVPDINTTIKEYQDKGKDVYCISLGDLTFNSYELLHDLAKENMDKLKPNTFYNVMGNHDNQTDVTGDWATTASYRNTFGPTYYSFNAGGIHYIILDNIEVPDGNNGNDYQENITTDVLKWFRNDLKNVDKSTPVVVCMHALLFYRKQVSDKGVLEGPKYRYGFGNKFASSVTGYKDVRVFTGHAHNNHVVSLANMTEYNVGSVSGNIWVNGYFHYDKTRETEDPQTNLVCCDGSPAGYRVMEVNNGEIKTYNKCIGWDRNYQFRSYDLNECAITPERHTPNIGDPNWLITDMNTKGWGYDYEKYNTDGTPKVPNQIRVKVFAPHDTWKVEIFEEGQPLEVKRVSGYDPYHIISDYCQRLDWGWSSSGYPTKNSHFYDAQAKSATSAITIKVTDEEGNVYVENMVRPKPLTFDQYKMGGPDKQVSSVMEISGDYQDSNAPIEYYDLYGTLVENPSKGIYIKRQGNKVTKVMIR